MLLLKTGAHVPERALCGLAPCEDTPRMRGIRNGGNGYLQNERPRSGARLLCSYKDIFFIPFHNVPERALRRMP
jgi:hypothetical protein